MTPAQATIKRWREDERGILQFGNENFGVTYDAWQERALLEFADPSEQVKRVSLQACVGPGKTMVLSHAGWWFLGVQGDKTNHPQGACISITGDNLRDNLWKEYSKWHQRSRYLSAAFTHTARRIFANDHAETWFLSARSWSKTANDDALGNTLSGLHSKYVLCQADESGEIPVAILKAGEQALSVCDFGRFIQGGNPTSLDGMLYAAANTLRHLWVIIRITGDPSDPDAWVHSPRVGEQPKKWAQQQIDTYGRENPWVKGRILGVFPPQSINALLGLEDVEAAQKRHVRLEDYEWSQKRIGVDVARFGDDRTVIFPRQGLVAFKPVVMRTQNTVNIAARVARGAVQWFKTDEGLILVDDTGHWGHGVIDNLTTAGYPAIGIVSSDPAIDPRYRNRRAEMWMTMAQWVKDGGALPPVEELVAELTTPTYTFIAGRFVLEDKDQIKERLGRSPDLGDALAHTFAMPDQPAGLVAASRRTRIAEHDGDPFEHVQTPGGGKAEIDGDPF